MSYFPELEITMVSALNIYLSTDEEDIVGFKLEKYRILTISSFVYAAQMRKSFSEKLTIGYYQS